MNAKLFLDMVDRMVDFSYGIKASTIVDIHDTGLPLVTLDWADECIRAGVRPYEAVNIIADRYYLRRLDLGMRLDSQAKINEDDERRTLVMVRDVVAFEEECVSCPKCGSRTNFVEVGAYQHHECLTPYCGEEFMAQDIDDDRTEVSNVA